MNAEIKSPAGPAPQEVFDPLAAYVNHYKQLHEDNAVRMFDTLTAKAGIDVALNQATIKELNTSKAKKAHIEKEANKKKTIKTTAIIFLIISIVFVLVGAVLSPDNLAVGLLVITASVAVAAFCIFVLVKIKPKLRVLSEKLLAKNAKIQEISERAWQQMRPLNSLLRPEARDELFAQTIPLIQLDEMFDSKRFDYLVNKFGFGQQDDINRSALFVRSGEIEGNPFFLCNDLTHKLGTKVYTGTKTIHWTTTSVRNGKAVTNHHTQTLSASINKPYPYFSEVPYLVYANEAAPDLIFNRNDSDAEKMTQKQIDADVKKKIKKLNKKAEKSITDGGGFTVMGNSEFEVLFGATDRNNEVQFRLLFTPLAQKQLLNLMKDKEIGFGDDFNFIKTKEINHIYPEQLRTLKFYIAEDFFHGHDIGATKSNFIKYNNSYFRHLYFTFAPILAIPLYRQQKPHEYIYKDLYESYVSHYAHEFVANNIGNRVLEHPDSVTKNILKTKVIKSENKRDSISITAYGYRSVDRIEVVTKLGRDARIHSIPIRWSEYIPVSQTTQIDVDIFMNEKELLDSNRYKDFQKLLEGGQDKSKPDLRRFGPFLAFIHKIKED